MPIPTTVSTAIPVIVQGKHVFRINNFSKHRGLGHDVDSFIRSKKFSVGGRDWAIRLYPDGRGSTDVYISVYLELMSKNVKVRASCDLRLVDHNTGLTSSVHSTGPRMFNSNDMTKYAPLSTQFKKRSELEPEGYLRDDSLTIVCIVDVFKQPRVTERESRKKFPVPPSDILQQLGRGVGNG